MPLFLRVILSAILSFVSVSGTLAATSSPASLEDNCDVPEMKKILKNGWFTWEPYQYKQTTTYGNELTGLDIELLNNLANIVGVKIAYDELDWAPHQQELKDGKKDIAAGSTYTEERAQYSYFSTYYRFEENSLFSLKNTDKKLDFNNIPELIVQLRLQNYRLGIVDGFVYADQRINDFINDNANKDIIFIYNDDLSTLQALLKNEIDGFISDRIVGAALTIKNNAGDKIIEIPLHIKTPIHLMFSKKSISIELIDKFNKAIEKFRTSQSYKKVIREYLYPVLLLQTVNADWFFYVSLIGIIAFALSGVALAARDNLTFFNALFLAFLPSIGSTIIRDLIVSKDKVGLFLTPFYMYSVVITVMIGFIIMRLLALFNKGATNDEKVQKFLQNLFTVTDALGQAAFIVTGVTVALMAKLSPIEVWAPFIAFITANGGGIIRDLCTKDKIITCLNGEVNAEVSVIWGLIFAIYLHANADNPSLETINIGVICVVFGAFATRLITAYFKIPNIKFKPN